LDTIKGKKKGLYEIFTAYYKFIKDLYTLPKIKKWKS